MNTDESNKKVKSKKINILMDYMGKKITFDFEENRTIEYLIEKTKELFFMVENIKVLYRNIDLIGFKDLTIKEHFLNKNKVQLKIVKNKKQYSDLNLINKKENLENFNKNSIERNSLSSISNMNSILHNGIIDDSLNLNIIDKSKLISIHKKNKDIKTMINSPINSPKNIKISINSPINTINKHSTSTKKDHLKKVEERNTENRVRNVQKKEEKHKNKSKFICECDSNLVKTYFDRNKNALICKNCRMDVN